LILIGSFLTRRWWTVVAAAGVILAAVYLLWAYQRVFHGEPDEDNASFAEIKWAEGLVMAPLVALIVFIGVYPKPYFDILEKPVAQIVERVRPGYFQAQVGQAVSTARDLAQAKPPAPPAEAK